jgi:Ca-activated chloride channel family protein
MRLRNNLLYVSIALILLFTFTGFGQSQQPSSSQPVFPSAQAQQAPPQQQQPAQQPQTQQPAQPQQPEPGAPQNPPAQPQQGQQLPQPDRQNPGQPGQQGQGQEPSTDQSGTYHFIVETEEKVLYATVVDEKGRVVTDLDKNAFTVFENGVPQQIKLVQRKDVPVGLGIVIDNSGSMREKRDKVNIAALDLVKSSNPDDKVFVVNFNEEYYLDQEFTGSIPKLQEALENIVQRGGTALYDAVLASTKYLEDGSDWLEKQAHIQKKVLFVVTDGVDNSSRTSLEQMVRSLQGQNTPTIYTIGILDQEDRRKGKRALQAMAEQTGGLAFFPKDAAEVDEIARTVARDIRQQYVIVYKKKPGQDYRQIKVVANAPGHHNLQVRTQTGYYAGEKRASNQ